MNCSVVTWPALSEINGRNPIGNFFRKMFQTQKNPCFIRLGLTVPRFHCGSTISVDVLVLLQCWFEKMIHRVSFDDFP